VRLCLSLSLPLLCGLILTECAPAPKELSRAEFVLGTRCTIRLAKGGSQNALDSAFRRLHQIDDEFNVHKAGTEVDAVNDAAGIHPVKVSQDVYAVARKDQLFSHD